MSTRPLRILHVLAHDRVKSGGAFQAILLARAQRRAGHEVRLAYNSGADEEAARAAFAGLLSEGFPCSPMQMQHFGRFAGRARLRALLAEFAPEVVHAHRERALRFVLAPLKRWPHAALIAQKGNCYRSDAATARALRHPRVDRIIAVAREVKRVLVQCDGVAAEKVDVVYGSYDPERFDRALDRAAARAELGVSGAAPVVGVLANLDRKKGHATFLAAAAQVSRERPDAIFVLVGGGDPAPLLERAQRLGIAERVRFTGFRADCERALAAFDVSVNSSKDGEGLTGALRESLALGIPVVATHVGGNAEIVETGVTGLLVPKDDAASLAGAILQLLAAPADAARMAEEGRRRVRAAMAEDVRCARVLAIYNEVLAWREPPLPPRLALYPAAAGSGRAVSA